MTTAQVDLVARRLIDSGSDPTIRDELHDAARRGRTPQSKFRYVCERVRDELDTDGKRVTDLSQLLAIIDWERTREVYDAESEAQAKGLSDGCVTGHSFDVHDRQFAIENRVCPRCSSSRVAVGPPDDAYGFGPLVCRCINCGWQAT